MPQTTAQVLVPVPPDVAFAVSQTTGRIRLRWDPFIRHQHLIGADRPAKGVQTLTKARLGPSMVSEYVSYRPPTSVGMTMVRGPWFFESFGGGWRFTAADGGTSAVWKYTWTVRPAWLRLVAEPVGRWLLDREIRSRISSFARACSDPEIVSAATLPPPELS